MEREIEVTPLPEQGYQPLVDFGGWRVAALCFCEDTKAEQIHTMQRHLETDEVFVLLSGGCTLLCGGSGEAPAPAKAVTMQPQKLYNVKKGVWHNHILTPDAAVLIVENRDTANENSPIAPVSNASICALLL